MKARSKMGRFLLVVATTLLAAMITFPGYGAGESAKETLIVGLVNTPPTIDHESGSGMAAQYMVEDSVMATGTRYPFVPATEPGMEFVLVPDPDLTRLTPNLYTSWEVSPDRRTATFHLRKGVISAYGNELTTKDILWKYQRHFALEAVGRFMMAVTDVPSVDSINIIDDYTFQTISAGSNALQEHLSTNLYDTVWDSTEAKKHATTDDPWAQDWIAKHGGGFGAYYVTEWVAGKRLVLEANPNHWAGVPQIKKIIFTVIPESSSRVAMIKDGTIDMAMELAPREIDALKGVPGVNVVSVQSTSFEFLIFNQKLVEPFTNKLVRQAINYAIPRDDLVKTAYYGDAKPWRAVIPTICPAPTDPEEWMYYYDLDKAKELLVKAGYPDGFDVELYYSVGWPAQETEAVLVRDSLAKIGIRVQLRKTPTGPIDTLIRSNECPFGIVRELPVIPNPFYSMLLFYLSRKAGGAYGAFGNYESDRVDKMLQEGIRTWPMSKQYERARETQKAIMEEAPCGWMVEINYTCAIRDDIEGMNWNFGQGTWFELMRFRK